MQRLLVSVRGPTEAIAAAKGGAHIIDVEYPGTALGTPYPLNIKAVRERLDADGFKALPISANIGEDQPVRSAACQAALGVAVAGADYIKCGLAGMGVKAAIYLGRNLVRTLREWFPDKKVYPAVFADEEFVACFDPLADGPCLVQEIGCDGLLIDTYHKDIGTGLLEYVTIDQIRTLATELHSLGKDAWVAGSLSRGDLPGLWGIGIDVVCVRGAACEPVGGLMRFGSVQSDIVRTLVEARRTTP